jgi:hypothetical protein
MTICLELQHSHRSLSLIFSKGKVSPRCARSFDSDNRAECLALAAVRAVVVGIIHMGEGSSFKPGVVHGWHGNAYRLCISTG